MEIFKKLINKIKRLFAFLQNRYLYFLLRYADDVIVLNCLLKWKLANRKLVAFYGECHVCLYNLFLRQNKCFRDKYVIFGGADIEYLSRRYNAQINDKSTWSHIDVLIYNPGTPRRENAPSLDVVLGWVPENCKKIAVTNAAFKGYMPQHTAKVYKNDGEFIWGDKNLNAYLETELNLEDVVRKLTSDTFYDYEYVNSYFDKSIDRLKKYERSCSVGIADYIEINGRKRPLYYSVTHPNFEVMELIAKRILIKLGIDADGIDKSEKIRGDYDLRSHGESIYPSVWKALDLEGDYQKWIIQPGDFKEVQLNFEEYITRYILLGNKNDNAAS